MSSRWTLHAWRTLALTSSLLAIAFVSRSRPTPPPLLDASVAARFTTANKASPTAELRASPPKPSANNDDAALDSLFAISEHAAPRVASAALQGIVQIGGQRARAHLAQRFADGADSELRELADALAQLGGSEARGILVQAARSTRIPAREAARAALASLDTADVRAFMLEELIGPDASQAAANFADCQDERAVPGLERLARSAGAELRRTAIAALFAQAGSARAAIERLLRDDDDVSNNVLESPAPTAALRQAQRAVSIQRLRAGAVTSGPVFDFLARDPTADALQALVQAAHDPASADSAISALSSRGDSASRAALSQLADDSDAGLASRAACALSTAPDSRSRPFLLRASRKLAGQAAAALLRIDAPEAAAALARLRMSSRASDRLYAERLDAQSDLGS